MDSIWFKPELSEKIIENDDFIANAPSIVTDLIAGRMDITLLVANLGGVLTDKNPENREKGMRFFTKVLSQLPKDHLNEAQVKFISKFYSDRLNDNHRVIPHVLEGYVAIIDMNQYIINYSAEFLTIMFREVPCQSQVRRDRYNIYLIIKKLVEKDVEFMKTLCPDFVYGFISAMDGERDPRNLIFLFTFLPSFLKSIPLGHLNDEMFEVISCYYPIDFHPSLSDPAQVTRDDLAEALCPCLCAINEFAEQCLVLLIEKLDSSLRLAKIDSLKLLKESCKTFSAESYAPFLKTLWSSVHREITQKTDEELKIAAHEALSALIAKISSTANTDQAFETLVKGILIAMQTSVASCTTVTQFVQATKVILTTANSSKEACYLVTKTMIPSTITYYEFKTSAKLQIASLEFLGDLYELAKRWEVLDQISEIVKEIPRLCLAAVSNPVKEYQIAGFKTLIRVKNALDLDLVVPFVEVLVHNVQHSLDNELLKVSVETTHAIARKYPELIMNFVVKGKCDLDNLTSDKMALQKRLNLLSNLASIDEFTAIIIEEMLKLITNNQEADKVVEALSDCMSNSSLYTTEKLTQIESDHGLIDSVINWLINEIEQGVNLYISHGYTLISNTVSSLPIEKQKQILHKHTPRIMEKCKIDEKYFFLIDSMYSSISRDLYDNKLEDIVKMCLNLALTSEDEVIKSTACGLIAHILNKAEYGQKFELLYESFKKNLATCKTDNLDLCPKIIILYGWVTKALILRGSDLFSFWLQKITITIPVSQYAQYSAQAIKLIMTEFPDRLTARQHCRISLLYKQRMFITFTKLTDNIGPLSEESQEAYMLSWAYILDKAPRSVISSQADKITPILIDALNYTHKDLLSVATDVLSHMIQAEPRCIVDSLQTVLPRLINLSHYETSMDVRIKSLQVLYDIANQCSTATLLPSRPEVLSGLSPALDDRKRVVRGAAVRARTRWALVGAPGEGE